MSLDLLEAARYPSQEPFSVEPVSEPAGELKRTRERQPRSNSCSVFAYVVPVERLFLLLAKTAAFYESSPL